MRVFDHVGQFANVARPMVLLKQRRRFRRKSLGRFIVQRRLRGSPPPIHNEIQYREPNRDRALGEADRTGRHFDEAAETPDENEAE